MTLSSTSRPAIRGRVLTRLPATLQASGGLQVVKENGIWTFSPDWTVLDLETSLPEPESRHLWVLNPDTDVYTRLSVSALMASALVGTSTTSLAVATGSNTWITQAGKGWSVGQRLRAASDDGATVMEGEVTAYSSTSLTIDVDRIEGSGTHADWNISIAGMYGQTAPIAGIRQLFDSTTTDADPGAGEFRLNHATPSSATAAYLDNLDTAGATVSSIIDKWDDSTTTTKGFLRIEKESDASIWAEFTVTGSVVDGTGYRKLTLSAGASNGTFAAGDAFRHSFSRAGDKGADGAGDVSGPAASVDNEIALFSSTTGKLIKRASLTGLVKATSGVASAATAGTDYVAPATATSFTAHQGVSLQTLTDGANISWTVSSAQKAKVTLGGNRTMNAVTGAVEGYTYYLWVIQDATGSRTISWTTSGAGSFDFGTSGAPTLTTAASKADLLCFEAINIGGTLKLRYMGIKKGFA